MKKIEKFFQYYESQTIDLGQSSLWNKYIEEFGVDSKNVRPSYGENVDISNDRVLSHLKAQRGAGRIQNLLNSIIDKVISRSLPLMTFFRRRSMLDYGLYLRDNLFFNFGECSESLKQEILNIHQKHNWKLAYTTVKASYYFIALKKIIDIDQFNGKSIIEIGPGGCQLARILCSELDTFNYICLDLPNMIAFGYKKMLAAKNVEIYLPHEMELFKSSTASRKVLFILPNQLDQIDFDLDFLVNIESFGEMPQKTANSYIEDIKKRMRLGAICYLVNRIARCTGTDNPHEIENWTIFDRYPLDDFETVSKTIDGFKQLKNNEKDRANIFYIGKYILK